jgi:hypothetical protein
MHFQIKIYKFQRDAVGINYPICPSGARGDLLSGKDMKYRTLTEFLNPSLFRLNLFRFSSRRNFLQLAKKVTCRLLTQAMRALDNNKNEF